MQEVALVDGAENDPAPPVAVWARAINGSMEQTNIKTKQSLILDDIWFWSTISQTLQALSYEI